MVDNTCDVCGKPLNKGVMNYSTYTRSHVHPTRRDDRIGVYISCRDCGSDIVTIPIDKIN